MKVSKDYEVLEESQNKGTFLKKMTTYFLSIGCPILSLILLCVFNVWSLHYSNLVDNNFLQKWNKEFGSFVNDYYLNKNTFQTFNSIDEITTSFSNVKLPDPPKADTKVCSAIVENDRFDCFPRGIVTEESCKQRGCCYLTSASKDVPICFYPTGFQSYSYTSINFTDNGFFAEMRPNFKLPYPNTPSNLQMKGTFMSENDLSIQIAEVISPKFDAFNTKKETLNGATLKNTMYDVVINPGSVGFKIVRKSTNVPIFDSENIGGFIYSNQFIQISTKLPCKHLYGLGEGRTDFPLNTNWKRRTLWNHDTIPRDDINGYGSYPIYMCAEGNGLAHMVLFENLYGTDIILQPNALTYRTIGPSLNIEFFLGTSPLDALKKPLARFSSIMPPYWSLGFHLCRLGYNTLDDMKDIWNKTREAGIPYDTQWGDIDYMKTRNDFTLSSQFQDLGSFVEMLHQEGMHFVPILDPGVSAGEPKGTYPPYDRGIELDIFIKDSTGKKPLIGKVWNPVSTVFPDFTHPKTITYWYEMINSFHKLVPFDGLWIDMNEPSNFVNGSITGCPKNNLENPPYVPGIDGGVLNYLTLCMSAKHYSGPHYGLHNMHGIMEAAVTSFSLAQIEGKRPFVITRAGSVGTGNYAGHWTGDVMSTWEDMGQTVKDIMHLSMYGLNLVGADICGFNGNTTVNLCRRWHQLGAFYPFSRNHNSDECIAQDPVTLNIVHSTKKALLLRYSLLPYLYTLFWEAKTNNLPVIRPLFYLFPNDEEAYTVNSQFMWGDGLLISPVLHEVNFFIFKKDITYVKAYLGQSIWYDIYTSDRIVSNSSESYALAAPEDTIPVLIRGGSIIVMQEPAVTTTLSRKNPFHLKVALNESNGASGMLYWDDGETLDGQYSTIYFGAINNTLMSCNDVSNYKMDDLYLNTIEIFSLDNVKNVTISFHSTVSPEPVPFTFNPSNKVLTLANLKLPIQKDFNVTWI